MSCELNSVKHGNDKATEADTSNTRVLSQKSLRRCEVGSVSRQGQSQVPAKLSSEDTRLDISLLYQPRHTFTSCRVAEDVRGTPSRQDFGR